MLVSCVESQILRLFEFLGLFSMIFLPDKCVTLSYVLSQDHWREAQKIILYLLIYLPQLSPLITVRLFSTSAAVSVCTIF